ncbi:hypothetical protein PINS_up006804 [Pythium insidiosum]|nr:hypothetical protein PINS_up006804 [Pythium insidiosum]
MMRGQNDTTQNTKRKGKKPQDQFSLSAFADGDALMLDGRMIIVTRAVARDDAERLTESNSAQRKAKDKRNMYLAYEGTINVNKLSEEELSLPKMDIEKRRRAIKEKKEKLKNPLYFVSPLRLSVRNLASHVDDAQLKQLFREAAITGMQQRKVDMRRDVKVELLPASERVPVKVKMAKIVRDMDNVRPGKEPRSRGYGFVEFAEHVHALAALRVVNNNPEYTSFTPGKGGSAEHEKSRLIVEFALENHGKLKLREKKQNDAKKKREEEKALKEAQGDDHKSQGQKKSRGQRQREKKKEAKEQPDDKKTDAKTKATKATPPQPKARASCSPSPRPPVRRSASAATRWSSRLHCPWAASRRRSSRASSASRRRSVAPSSRSTSSCRATSRRSLARSARRLRAPAATGGLTSERHVCIIIETLRPCVTSLALGIFVRPTTDKTASELSER